MTRVTIGLAVCVIVFAIPLYSQPILTVTPWNNADVTFDPFDPTTHLAFAELFQQPLWRTQQPYALILENTSPQEITALTIIWRTTGGNNETIMYFDDSYDRSGKVALVSGNGKAVITPIGILSAELAQSQRGLFSGSIPTFQGLARVDMSLDTVIFADGRVIGSDESQTLSSITNRKIAAEALVASFRTAITEGQDVNTMLASVASSASSDPFDYFGSWTERFAARLLRENGANRLAYLTQLENLPSPPIFFRSQ